MEDKLKRLSSESTLLQLRVSEEKKQLFYNNVKNSSSMIDHKESGPKWYITGLGIAFCFLFLIGSGLFAYNQSVSKKTGNDSSLASYEKITNYTMTLSEAKGLLPNNLVLPTIPFEFTKKPVISFQKYKGQSVTNIQITYTGKYNGQLKQAYLYINEGDVKSFNNPNSTYTNDNITLSDGSKAVYHYKNYAVNYLEFTNKKYYYNLKVYDDFVQESNPDQEKEQKLLVEIANSIKR